MQSKTFKTYTLPYSEASTLSPKYFNKEMYELYGITIKEIVVFLTDGEQVFTQSFANDNFVLTDIHYDKLMALVLKSPTNSPIGSRHWYNTILSYIKDVGEVLEKGDSYKHDPTILSQWGKLVKEKAKHLIENYEHIPNNDNF